MKYSETNDKKTLQQNILKQVLKQDYDKCFWKKLENYIVIKCLRIDLVFMKYSETNTETNTNPDHVDKLKDYLSSKHPNINFSIVKEKDVCLPFLDVNILCENKKFATNVYRKKTFSWVYTNFKSFIPETHKIGLIRALLFRCFSLCSDFIKFHHDIDKLKSFCIKTAAGVI